ncbi:cbb3-type cytochrome oxidase subunit 3 [Pseudoxanthomonas suwonensis]|uniref:cbb3-type cytochrome oxidase subunit 3 n=1 Tax=Pseudoxanthomonas suwonensis TaxID=314722 RepID=UPI00138F251C|nr:cbb3-type cytochrome c oxidase subunit 3 [Pseudoxanthomonas suwonensis]KAF1700435.1 CcoQ/FixQ family Cbb3-type cytochrome c oxidase assembly chaperone [Pseudoxanthomonas suwonensis]
MISGIVTALLLVLFIGGWIWAWSPARRTEFEEAAHLPLEEDSHQGNIRGNRA